MSREDYSARRWGQIRAVREENSWEEPRTEVGWTNRTNRTNRTNKTKRQVLLGTQSKVFEQLADAKMKGFKEIRMTQI